MENKPNIVWIMADDMGYGDVAAFNPESRVPTPNMDRLAAQGMRFTDAHSSSAVCTPSRYSVLTGRYCWRTRLKHGVNGGFSLPLIDPARLTTAALLQRRGYTTAAIGKWHVGLEFQTQTGARANPDNWEDEGLWDYTKPIIGGPNAVGFDYFFGIAGSLDMPPYCFIENNRTVGIPNVPKAPYYPQQRKGFMTPDWKDAEVDRRFAEKAVGFIEGHTDAPFFLYLTPAAPHRPCVPPDFAKGRSQAGPRGDMVWLVDWVLGQVLEALDRTGVAHNTLVFLTSDNGPRLADVDGNTYGHRAAGLLRGCKADIWEGGHRVPLLARWPAETPAGVTCDAPVGLFDLMATCAEIADHALPENAAEDSVSLLPLLRGQSPDGPTGRHEAMVHHSLDGMFALRRARWKTVFGLGSGGFSQPRRETPGEDGATGQLYDMCEDWRETTNRWLDLPDVVGQAERLLAHYRETGRSR
ncbi:MAG: arylsulfatase [Kiritimatiellaeota bacterium]|nr:arylsulfatase [Kiritimatiellota bacterium]